MSDRVDLKEFVSGYLEEADDLLGTASAQLLALDAAVRRGESNLRALRELFRAMHTVKGLSAMVGVDPIVDLAHALETLLRNAERASGTLDAAALDHVHQGLRAIEQRVGQLGRGESVSPAPPTLLEALEAAGVGAAAPASPSGELPLALEPALVAKLTPAEREELVRGVAAGRRAVRVDFTPSPGRAAAGVTITTVRERLAALGDLVRVVPLSVPPSADAPGGLKFALLLLTEASDEAIAGAAEVPPSSLEPVLAPADGPAAPEIPHLDEDPGTDGPRRNVVRVEVGRLDEAMERLSALVVTRFRLEQAMARLKEAGADVRELAEILAENRRQLRDLRAAIVRVRMVPVAELLERVPLLVRGLRRATGKLVRVELDVGRAELDKGVAERIFPAIVHLIRNAVDHAIEPPEERRAAGKPEEGVVRVTCAERGNNRLEIHVADDGRGIDAAALATRAGREPPTSDAGLLELMTTPGLSTRSEATATSGRGLGMDIVRRIVVADLGGELLVRTAAGGGSVFTLRVPLTISIVEAFTFECARQRFVVPVASVDEIVEVPAAIVRNPAEGGIALGVFERRGEAVPLVPLGGLFRLPGESELRKALVVRRAGEPYAFAVDRMLGQQEVVVRPLEDPLVRRPGITGTTDLGDGRPTLVLDLVALSGTLTPEASA